MSDFTNRVCIAAVNKVGEKNFVIARGTFQGGISFPKDGSKPFKVVERKTKNGKTFKQVRATVVITPDDRKSDNGYPISSVYFDGKSMTFAEFLAANNVELYNGKLYATAYMDRDTMGLYQLLGDPNLTFKQNVVVSGEMTFSASKQTGKVSAYIGNVSMFAKDHIFADKVEKENANCMLDGAQTAQAAPTQQAAPAQASAPNQDFVDISDEDDELPF